MIFLTNAPIVDMIIENIPWDRGDVEVQTHANMMPCCLEIGDESKTLADGKGHDCFFVLIRIWLQFSLEIDNLSAGLSFRQAGAVLLANNERSAVTNIGSCSDSAIFKYAQISCLSAFKSCTTVYRKHIGSLLPSTCPYIWAHAISVSECVCISMGIESSTFILFSFFCTPGTPLK